MAKRKPAKKAPAKKSGKTKAVDRPEWDLMGLRREAEPFVVEGCVALRTVSYYGVSEPIADGESAIRNLAIGRHDNLIGTTRGKQCHLFYYGFHPSREQGLDVGVIPGATDIGGGMPVMDDGTVVGTYSPGTNLFLHDSKRDGSYFCSYTAGDIETRKLRLGDKAIHALTAGPKGKVVYGITVPRGLVFRHDIETKKTQVLDETGFERISDVLICTPSGDVYGGMANGALFRLDTGKGRVELVDAAAIPCDKGRDFQNVLTAATLDDEGNVYGGGSDGYIFRYEPASRRMISLGRPTKHQQIRCMTWGRDHRLYGISGETDQASHLFRYDPALGEMKDLGILKVSFPFEWVATVFDCMTTGPNGEIYLGEADRRSHIFIYYPPCG